jgi:hypothetical protein
MAAPFISGIFEERSGAPSSLPSGLIILRRIIYSDAPEGIDAPAQFTKTGFPVNWTAPPVTVAVIAIVIINFKLKIKNYSLLDFVCIPFIYHF